MAVYRAADPAGQARRAQARGERPGSHEWGHVRPEHGLPVAGDPEGLAAQKHSLRLLGFMVLRRHAGAYPLRALCQMPRAGGT